MKATVTILLEEYNVLLSLKKQFDEKKPIIFHSCDGYYLGAIAIDNNFREKAKVILVSILNDDEYWWKRVGITEPKASWVKKIINKYFGENI